MVTRVRFAGFRNLARAEVALGEGVTLLWGPNGAGKTNVLEAVCLALSGRSLRTRNEREAIAFGEPMARVEADVDEAGERREFLWSLSRAGERRRLLNGAPMPSDAAELRPALAIFLPDRLALVKGPPAERRAHLDSLCAALWPGRAEARRRYGQALAQRNALLGRVRSGRAAPDSLKPWDRELGALGVEVMDARRQAVERLAREFAAVADELGLGEATIRYAPRSGAGDADELAAELRDRREADLRRGHTTHGPHLDELALAVGGRPLRRYGSQGEQRTALLALLFAERRALSGAGRSLPLLLLDDVMSELDPQHRALLARRLGEGGGQAVVTATEPDQLPGGCERVEVALRQGEVIPEIADEARAEVPH